MDGIKSSHEWCTPRLPEAHWPEAVTAVVKALQVLGIETLELMHGWSASDFDGSPEFGRLQWQPETVQVADLTKLLRQRQALSFCLGWDDLFLTLPDGTEIKFCHEGYLHLAAPSAQVAAVFQGCLASRGLYLEQRG